MNNNPYSFLAPQTRTAFQNYGNYAAPGAQQMIVDFVSGETEAHGYQMPYGATAFLFDREQSIFYQKIVSADGQSGSFQAYNFAKRPEPVPLDASQFVRRDEMNEFVAEIKNIVEGKKHAKSDFTGDAGCAATTPADAAATSATAEPAV